MMHLSQWTNTMRSRVFAGFMLALVFVCTLITFSRSGDSPIVITATPTPRDTLYHALQQAQTNNWQADELLTIGDMYQQMGMWAQALAYWQEALVAQPTLNVSQRVVRVLLQQGEWAQALTTLQATLVHFPNDAPTNAQVGFLLAVANPSQALPYLRKALPDDTARDLMELMNGRDDNDALYQFGVGSILASGGHYAEAEATFMYLSAFTYPNPEAMAQVGLMRDLQGKHGADWIEQAVAFAPDSPSVRLIQALHLRANGEPELALEALQKVLVLQPNNPMVFTEIALTYEGMGLTEDARVWRDRAQALTTTP
jgi:tetratricopeptide (TPR) repeat protein